SNLAYAFSWFQNKNELSDSTTLNIIIDFIQQIPYEIPENDYGIFTPTEVLYKNAGDCDSKSVLAAILLQDMGYDTVLYYSKEYKHVMLGINVPSTGEYKELNGKSYYITEMTSPGWQIGDISPDCADLRYWNIISLRQPEEPKEGINPEVLAIPMSSTPENIIKHTGFSLLYSPEHEQAAWVVYVLTSKEVMGTVARSNNFREDPSIRTESATLADYKGSGYDRGHLAPAGDLKWNESAMKDSFFLSNMSPQEPGFNRGIWKNLEEWTREQTVINGELIVITGPVLTDGPYDEIGENGVDIPKRYFKVLLDYKEPEIKGIGFIMENKASKEDIFNFAVSIDTVEDITGIDFLYLLPDMQEENMESHYNTNLWQQ
ncbi:MAG: DNA/RNA non-specific endonuclease, partial [Spirochaetia bacterium]|nr:DNA/RNA non-specific endonuclease [Spirochaetia bacterium]